MAHEKTLNTSSSSSMGFAVQPDQKADDEPIANFQEGDEVYVNALMSRGRVSSVTKSGRGFLYNIALTNGGQVKGWCYAYEGDLSRVRERSLKADAAAKEYEHDVYAKLVRNAISMLQIMADNNVTIDRSKISDVMRYTRNLIHAPKLPRNIRNAAVSAIENLNKADRILQRDPRHQNAAMAFVKQALRDMSKLKLETRLY